jgi:uncharacterized protein YraI
VIDAEGNPVGSGGGTTPPVGPVPDPIEETIDDIKDLDPTDSGAALTALEGMDVATVGKAMEEDAAVVTKIGEIEAEYLADNAGITVAPVAVDPEAAALFDGGAPTVDAPIGMGLNAATPSSTLELTIDKVAAGQEKTVPSNYDAATAVQLDLSLTGAADPADLEVPMQITMPIPAGLTENGLRVLHYKTGGGMDTITPTSVGGGEVSFIVTGFSPFVFVNVKASAPNNGSDHWGGNYGDGHDYWGDTNYNAGSSSGTIVPAAPAAPVANTFRVTARALNVRSGSGTSYGKIGTVRANEIVTIIGYAADGLWAQLSTGGWVSMAYIAPINVAVDVGDYIVTATTLNVRSGPGTSSAKIGSLTNNALVMVTAVTNGWAQIEYHGGIAYVSAADLR